VPFTLLNGMTADDHGNLLVADSLLGYIWRVPAGGGEAELWLDLEAPGPPDPSPTNPPSANGVKFAPNGDLYVSIPIQSRIVRINVHRNGMPGRVSTFVQGPDITPDDFAFDEEGNLYLATEPSHSVMKISPCGEREVLVDASDGLMNTTAVQFSTRRGEAKELYITNGPIPAPGAKPSLMRMKVRERGYPVVLGW
jgi:sugar lactone lactonase YvrE